MVAPQANSTYVPDEILHCVTNPDIIGSFNWGKYIVDNIMLNAKRVQHHHKDKIGVCLMGGFQLVLQAFFAEWMDFQTSMTPNVWPRISAYSTEILREIFILARDPKHRFKTKAEGALSETRWYIHPILLRASMISMHTVQATANQFISSVVCN
ncbi:uncharacterized protein [Aegilops tauschii subsp. strangulata]|uniref:uncharacterized protein n=1 Tax=Aegilops tauschii subsp. strangulata TaxID=200361 RepID=UPI003CC8BBDA